MPAPLVVVAGTGTGVGKTHVAIALLHAWQVIAPGARGWKPVETGAHAFPGPDQAALAAPFHVKPLFGRTFAAPVSPHFAARQESDQLSLDELQSQCDALRSSHPGLLVELAGGLFTPLTDAALNVDLVARLRPNRVVLVAPDRLGVLHDVLSTMRAALASPVTVHAVVLSAPAQADASTGTNGLELGRLLPDVSVTDLPRGAPSKLAELLSPLLPAPRSD